MIRLTIIRNDLTDFIKRLESDISRRVIHAATYEFWNITRASFGVNKPDRPAEWAPLSDSYKKQLRRKSPGTPLVPTLLRSGTLLNSIRLRIESNTTGVVWTDCPYASPHQFGSGKQHIPARTYFPVMVGLGDGYQLTPYALNRINQVINLQLQRI